jgi:CRISPR-associated protein Cmr5
MKHTIKGIEQGRAKEAYDCAGEGEKLSSSAKKEYKSYSKKLPMLIKTNGLGAAMAFAFAKGSKDGRLDKKKAWGLLYSQIEEWLKKDSKGLLSFDDNEKLTAKLVELDSSTYRAVTIEVLAFLSWLRRFAEGLI